MERTRSRIRIFRNAGMAIVLGASLFGTPSFAQKEGLARETLEQLVSVPPAELNDADLALRIQLNRRLLKDNVAEIGGIKLRNLLRADRKELRKRSQADGTQQETAETPPETPQTAEQDTAAEQENDRKRKRAERRAAKEKAKQEKAAQEAAAEAERQQQDAAAAKAAADKAAADQAAAEQAAADQAAADRAAAKRAAEAEERRATEQQQTNGRPNANRRARQSLKDGRASAKLNIAKLRTRIEETEDILQDGNLRRALRRALRDRVRADRAALETKLANRQERRDRQAERRQERQDREAKRQERRNDRKADNRLARQLLEDKRPAGQLGMPELRDRVNRTRDALQAENMGEKLNKRLLARLSKDRDELRSRIAQREGRSRDREVRDQVLENRNARNELLSDRRPSHRLKDRQLDRRIEQASSLLESGRMRPAVRANLERMLRNDRAEKRDRLLQAREDRRRNLRRQARQPRDFSIELGRSGIRFNLDIVAAEEDNETIQRQLLAPPRREIRQQYSLNEFRQRPELRDYMPGIELDTIRFGSNEAFIRAEEISNLDAIGEIIEEIVFSQPGEVFLIEGHTDAVGSDSYNFALSQERALGVKEALLDYFNIPAENLVAIGYGERYLRIPTPFSEQENRRVSVRRITPLLSSNW